MTWDEIKQIWTRLLCMVRLCQQFEDHKTEDGEGCAARTAGAGSFFIRMSRRGI